MSEWRITAQRLEGSDASDGAVIFERRDTMMKDHVRDATQAIWRDQVRHPDRKTPNRDHPVTWAIYVEHIT